MQPETEPVLTEKEVNQILRSRASERYQTMSFKVNRFYLQKLRAYAYTNGLEIKQALEQALKLLLDPIPDDQLTPPPAKKER